MKIWVLLYYIPGKPCTLTCGNSVIECSSPMTTYLRDRRGELIENYVILCSSYQVCVTVFTPSLKYWSHAQALLRRLHWLSQGSYSSTPAEQSARPRNTPTNMGVVASYTPVGATHRISRSVRYTKPHRVQSLRPRFGYYGTESLCLVAFCTLPAESKCFVFFINSIGCL